jgi:hypothetical protein
MFTATRTANADVIAPLSPTPPKSSYIIAVLGMTVESTSLVLLSYDVSATHRSAASRVAHLIFSRKDAAADAPVPFIRRSGVVWIGQSVFLMPKAIAAELTEKLHGLGAAVASAHVSIPAAEIEALRRGARRPRSS